MQETNTTQYIEEDGLEYRLNTILQFGDSWNLIGNIVLANPGSAKPQKKITINELINLNYFFEATRDEVISFSDD